MFGKLTPKQVTLSKSTDLCALLIETALDRDSLELNPPFLCSLPSQRTADTVQNIYACTVCGYIHTYFSKHAQIIKKPFLFFLEETSESKPDNTWLQEHDF